MEALEARRQSLLEEFENSAGIDPLEDRRRVGYLAGLNDFLRIDLDDMETDQE